MRDKRCINLYLPQEYSDYAKSLPPGTMGKMLREALDKHRGLREADQSAIRNLFNQSLGGKK